VEPLKPVASIAKYGFHLLRVVAAKNPVGGPRKKAARMRRNGQHGKVRTGAIGGTVAKKTMDPPSGGWVRIRALEPSNFGRNRTKGAT